MIRSRVGGTMLLWSLFSLAVAWPAAASQAPQLSVSAYMDRLDELMSVLSEQPSARSALAVDAVPNVWTVAGTQQAFEIDTLWLRRGLHEWQSTHDPRVRNRLQDGLRTMKSEAALFLQSPAERSSERARLNEILNGRDFQSLHRPTWLDELKQRIALLLLRFVDSSQIPTISTVVVWFLIGLALVAGGFWAYRLIGQNAAVETMQVDRIVPSPKEWQTWLAEAQSEAADGRWREAVHASYWCSVSYLEAKGAWRRDRARTPREYVDLLPSSSGDRSVLDALTRRFERVWYGADGADAQVVADALASLKKLGCPSV